MMENTNEIENWVKSIGMSRGLRYLDQQHISFSYSNICAPMLSQRTHDLLPLEF